jgi:hypothetical protein
MGGSRNAGAVVIITGIDCGFLASEGPFGVGTVENAARAIGNGAAVTFKLLIDFVMRMNIAKLTALLLSDCNQIVHYPR